MGGFFGPFQTTSHSGGSTVAALGARLAFASPAGGAVAAAPAGFSANPAAPTGRLLVTLTGNTTWISLTPGFDGQLLEVKNIAGGFTLTLPQAAFNGVGDILLGPSNGILLYYDATQAAWEVTSP